MIWAYMNLTVAVDWLFACNVSFGRLTLIHQRSSSIKYVYIFIPLWQCEWFCQSPDLAGLLHHNYSHLPSHVGIHGRGERARSHSPQPSPWQTHHLFATRYIILGGTMIWWLYYYLQVWLTKDKKQSKVTASVHMTMPPRRRRPPYHISYHVRQFHEATSSGCSGSRREDKLSVYLSAGRNFPAPSMKSTRSQRIASHSSGPGSLGPFSVLVGENRRQPST